MTTTRKKTAPHGELSTHNGFSLISNEKLTEIYGLMLKCRMIEERMARSGSRGNARFNAGQVSIAAIAAASVDLLPTDTVAPSHRALIPCFAKGMPLAAIFALHAGERPPVRPSYGSLKLIAPRLTTERQLERALGAATKARTKKNKPVAVVFSSDFSLALQPSKTALARAGKKKLPILFVVQSADGQEVAAAAEQYGFPGFTVDGDDAVAVYRVATEALAHARRGSGPTLIECKPWPLAHGKQRGPKAASDPLRNMETYLTRKGLFSRKFKAQLIADFRRELDAAIK